MEKALTKYFWVMNLATLAAVAFFLASGVGQTVASQLHSVLDQGDVPRPQLPRSSGARAIALSRQKDGTDILARNIFDSSVGPLDGMYDDFEPGEILATSADNLPIVPCTSGGVTLQATVASIESPEWSFATITDGKDRRLCRIGDSVNNRVVSWISWRYLFLKGTGDECYVDLFGGKEPARTPARNGARGSREPADFKNGIKVISDTERTVTRALVDRVLSDPTKFARSVRVRPHKKNGEVVGFKLRRVTKGSPLEMLGAKRGDVIHSVNGIKLTSVDQALAAYQSLRAANRISFDLTRGGKPTEMVINVN